MTPWVVTLKKELASNESGAEFVCFLAKKRRLFSAFRMATI
jgi:hypothetical protein